MQYTGIFDNEWPVVGMVHLPGLPGAPGGKKLTEVYEQALADAQALIEGGVDAMLIENYGDRPYYPENVPKHTVAQMTAVTKEIQRVADIPVGINVLRNDAKAAIAIAAAANADFVRVNVHTGTRVTDQGLLSGCAHESLRLREKLDSNVQIWADVAVKHSQPVTETRLSKRVVETIDRGCADAVIISGTATGTAPEPERVKAAVDAVNKHGEHQPVIIGSGVNHSTIDELRPVGDGAIVGTEFKKNSEVTAPVDAKRVESLIKKIDNE